MIYAEIDKKIPVRLPHVTLRNCTGTLSSLPDASHIYLHCCPVLWQKQPGGQNWGNRSVTLFFHIKPA